MDGTNRLIDSYTPRRPVTTTCTTVNNVTTCVTN